MLEQFKYQPVPLEVPTFTKVTDYSTPTEPVVQLSGFERQNRHIYKYICEFAYHARVDDYLKQGLTAEYKKYLRKVAEDQFKGEALEDELETIAYYSKTDLQTMIAQEMQEVALELAGAYERLDTELNDEFSGEEEDDFNYQGSSELWVYASKQTLNRRLLPQHNELTKWFYILLRAEEEMLKRLNNPFIIKYFLERIYIHPVIGHKLDITLNPSRQSYGNKRILNGIRKKFSTSIENQRATKLFDCETRVGQTKMGYIDGEDLMTSINMYMFAVRFSNLFRKYDRQPSIHQCALFSGYLDKRSMSTMANQLSDRIPQLEERLANTRDVVSPEEREIIQRKIDHYSRYAYARQHISDLVSVPAEQILSNPNAKNVAGPIYMLKAMENSMWNEPKEEVQERKLVVEFNYSDVDIKP